MSTLPIYNMVGKEVEKMSLKDDFFDGQINTALLHQAVIMYEANKRQGTAATKDRSEVRGGGRKPWRQKGTGRARAGSTRSPLWRHGGVTFGPKPRDYSYSIPRKMKLIALKSSLNAKLAANDLILMDDINLKEAKTKAFLQLLNSLKIVDKALLIAQFKDNSVLKAARNISYFDVLRPHDVTAYDVLKHKKIIITKHALRDMIKRFKEKND
jgi:large subunit ribosomal protein L4